MGVESVPFFRLASSKTNLPRNNYLFFDQKLIKVIVVNKGKGKAIPLQAWTDAEGSRRLRLPDFKTIGT